MLSLPYSFARHRNSQYYPLYQSQRNTRIKIKLKGIHKHAQLTLHCAGHVTTGGQSKKASYAPIKHWDMLQFQRIIRIQKQTGHKRQKTIKKTTELNSPSIDHTNICRSFPDLDRPRKNVSLQVHPAFSDSGIGYQPKLAYISSSTSRQACISVC